MYSVEYNNPELLKDGKHINVFNEFGHILIPILQKHGIDTDKYSKIWFKLEKGEDLTKQEENAFQEFVVSTGTNWDGTSSDNMRNLQLARKEFLNQMPTEEIRNAVADIMMSRF